MKEYTEKELEKLLKCINSNDLKEMFGACFSSVILAKDSTEVINKLKKYSLYDVPVALGNIVEIEGKRYIVTCVYTDNSVDLLSEDATKYNVGLYKKDVKVVGKLQCIEEG